MMLFVAMSVKEREELLEELIQEVDITTFSLRLAQDAKVKAKSSAECAVYAEDK